jgi:ribosomal-protein-alanine N-acetyltransferase
VTVAVSPFRLRPMTPADIPQVVEIERAAFSTTWPPATYRRELERGNLSCYLVVVERRPAPAAGGPPAGGRLTRLARRLGLVEPAPSPPAERIVGFLGMWLMVDEAHIVTVAVREETRRRGVGELLLAEALAVARARGADTVTLECRVSNTAAQALYEKYGFRRAGIRKRYYTDNGEDAVIMTTPSLTDPAYAAHLAALRRAHVERHGVSASPAP